VRKRRSEIIFDSIFAEEERLCSQWGFPISSWVVAIVLLRFFWKEEQITRPNHPPITHDG